MSKAIDITTYEPHPLLKKYIRKISVFKSKGKLVYQQKLTPTAFMYLTYHHEDIPPNKFGKEIIEPDFRLQIDGPKINSDAYILYDGVLDRILVEFEASGFYYLFHESPSQYIDKLISLESFFTDGVIKKMEGELRNNNNSQEQIKIIENFLLSLCYKALPFCDYVQSALKIINDSQGQISITNLLEKLSISRRQFNRQFTKIVGISPKRYSKILQLHYIINTMSMKNYNSMQEISNNSEFYDLSHFNHTFKELTGFSPIEFVNSDNHIALKYFTNLIK